MAWLGFAEILPIPARIPYTIPAPLTPIFCFAFWMPACILLPTRTLDGNTDCSTTLLDLQRRPTPLSLGHSFRTGQGDVARRRVQARRNSRLETGAQGRPGIVLPLGPGANAVFDRRSHTRPLP